MIIIFLRHFTRSNTIPPLDSILRETWAIGDSYLYALLIYRIKVQHSHKYIVDRDRMQVYPSPKDVDVTVVAYADGHDPATLRTVNGTIIPIQFDVALLHSQISLGLKDYPTPAKYHVPPHDKAATDRPADIAMLGYNGAPSMSTLVAGYPAVAQVDLVNAVRDLWIDRLSYSPGKTAASNFGIDVIVHRISCLPGASGSPILDCNGNIIGIFVSRSVHMKGLHSRGSHVQSTTNPALWMVDTTCSNYAVSLDATHIKPFFKNVVIPRLSANVRPRWEEFVRWKGLEWHWNLA